MAVYNLSYMNNATSPIDLIVNTAAAATGNQYLIGNLIIFAFFIIFMFLSVRSDTLTTAVVGSFITSIIAILLAAVSLIAWPVVMFPIAIFIITLIFMFIT